MAHSIAALALAGLLAGPSQAPSPAPASAGAMTRGTSTADAPASTFSAGTITDLGSSTATSARLASRRRARRPDRTRLPRPPSSRLKADRLGRKELRGARTAVAVGGSLFAVFYLGSTLAAASEIDDIHEDGQITPDERDPRRISQLMFVPVAGPLVAASLETSKAGKAAFVVQGLLQGMAATAVVIGGVALARDRRARRLALSAGWTPGGASVGVRGRF